LLIETDLRVTPRFETTETRARLSLRHLPPSV
jgi:hypothetical protein